MASRIPSLNWLRVFETAARAESFARAAHRLNMSPPAVSQQIRALEEHLGRALFVRGPQSVTLTESGRAYFPAVQRALLTLEDATDTLFGPARAQVVYVQSVLMFAHGILPRALLDFEKTYPGIQIMLSSGNAGTDFLQGFHDLKIVFGNPYAFGRESDCLMGESLFAVAMPSIAETIATPADLQSHPLIDVATHRSGWEQYLDALDVPPGPRKFRIVDNTLIAIAIARQGCGIALARSPASDAAIRDAGLVACLGHPGIDGLESYHLTYDSGAALRAPAKLFRTWLIDWLATAGYR